MKIVYYSLLAIAALSYVSCQKSLSFEEGEQHTPPPPPPPPNDFQHSILNARYRLTAFYSDKPIDFITDDSVVKSETDLWAYVPAYLKDDEYLFTSDTTFTIYQNAYKIPGNNADSIKAKYSIDSTGGKTVMNFVDYRYQPLPYQLDTFNKDYYLVHVPGPNGSTLYSKFIRLP